MGRRAFSIFLRAGFLAFIAWAMHTPRLDLNDAEETRECANRALARSPNSLQLQTLNAVGDGRYTGEAVASDGRVFQIEIGPDSGGARMDAKWRGGSEGRGEEFRTSGLSRLSLARHPMADQVCSALLLVLLFGPLFIKSNSAPNVEAGAGPK